MALRKGDAVRATPDLPPVFEPVPLGPGADPVQRAARLAGAGAEEGTLVWCSRPGTGRARLGSEWQPPQQGLSLGLVLRPEEPLSQTAQAALVAILALGAAVAQEVPAMTDLRYRWPNNLLLGAGRAAAVNLIAGDAGEWLVLAFHANLAGEPAGLGATSILGEAGIEPSPELLLEAFARQLLAWIHRWADEGSTPVQRAWRQRGARPGESVRLALPDGMLEGTLADVGEDGSLVLELPGGNRRAVSLAEAFGLPR